jgi:hypothetical protein
MTYTNLVPILSHPGGLTYSTVDKATPLWWSLPLPHHQLWTLEAVIRLSIVAPCSLLILTLPHQPGPWRPKWTGSGTEVQIWILTWVKGMPAYLLLLGRQPPILYIWVRESRHSEPTNPPIASLLVGGWCDPLMPTRLLPSGGPIHIISHCLFAPHIGIISVPYGVQTDREFHLILFFGARGVCALGDFVKNDVVGNEKDQQSNVQ